MKLMYGLDINNNNMTKKQKELIEKVKADLFKAVDNQDVENAHGDADDLLCDLLNGFGFEEIVKIYNNVDKWYA